MTLYEKSVTLTIPLNNTVINSYAPCNLTLNPFQLTYSNKIYQIDYLIDDNIVKSQRYYFNNIATNGIPFPNDEGDPRNHPLKAVISLSDSIKKDYNVKINTYTIGSVNPNTISFVLSLSAPKMDGSLNAYFSSVHLSHTRMFGVDNNILYVFETKKPNYYIPLLINWKEKPIEIEVFKIENKYRSYELLSNFQNEKEENKHIYIIP